MTNDTARRENQGLWLGLLGVVIFALTLPMTRLATGTVDAPRLSPWFVTWGRAALAGGLSAVYLLVVRAPWPQAAQRGPLYVSLAGNAIGYPLLLGFALRQVTSGHAAVVTALLPLATEAAVNTVFQHGVASGDPLADRVILWTRVTPASVKPAVTVSYVIAAAVGEGASVIQQIHQFLDHETTPVPGPIARHVPAETWKEQRT